MSHRLGLFSRLVVPALLTLAFGLQAAVAADCPAAPQDAAKIVPMPNLKMKEPMPTGMAKDGTMKDDVSQAAAGKAPCMDMMLKKDEQTLDKKSTN